MMIHEFIDRTGFKPTAEEYAEIEKQYMGFNGDKDAFCKAFDVEQACARRLARMDNMKNELEEMRETAKKREDELKRQIEKLQAKLDRELEWNPYEGAGTNVKQEDYLHLANSGRKLSDEEAKQFIHDEFGFATDKIEIIHEVSTYEVNKHRQCRKAETFRREPYYEATDWYYIRFDVEAAMTWQWEVFDGEIEPYSC